MAVAVVSIKYWIAGLRNCVSVCSFSSVVLLHVNVGGSRFVHWCTLSFLTNIALSNVLCNIEDPSVTFVSPAKRRQLQSALWAHLRA